MIAESKLIIRPTLFCSNKHKRTERMDNSDWRGRQSLSTLTKAYRLLECCVVCLSKRQPKYRSYHFNPTTTSAKQRITNTAGDQNINQNMVYRTHSDSFRSHLLKAFSLSGSRVCVCLCVCVPHSHSKFFTKLTPNQWKFISVRAVEK